MTDMDPRDFDVYMIDPPWPQRKGGKRSVRPRQGRSLDYRTMSLEKCFDLLRNEILPPRDCQIPHVVFLWCIDKFLHDVETVFEDDLGYRLHARLIWSKGNGIAPAYTVRWSHEYLLWFYRPTLLPVSKKVRGKFLTVFEERPREHSRKPDVAYSMVESLYPVAKRLDVFARERRDLWTSWGDEVDRFR